MPVGSASDTDASLDAQGDVDYFSLDISASAALTVETTGGADTFGQLESQDGLIIASADVGGSGGNFRIEREVPAATYYVRVSGATRNVTGPYMLLVRTSDATPPGPRSQGAPDLMVYGVSVATNPSGTPPGGSFTLSAGVRNDGDAASAATTLRYYRSTDATITTTDTSVGTDAVGGLAAAATSSESIDLTAPSAAGTYYYGACVDAVAGESDATNNCSASVQVSVAEVRAETHPDLAVGSPSVSDSSPTSGATFSLSAAVRNDGDGAAAATTLRYYRSTDATITTADTSVGTDAVGGLAAAATSSESIDLTAPSAPGTFYYGACVDAVTGESDTTNNCSSAVSVTVSAPPPPLPAGPDLTVHGIVTVTSLDGTPPGGSFQLGAAVENQGDEPSAATTLRYYHSTDATITPSDTEVGTDTVGGLSAGATTRIGTDVTAPASAGTYYYGACVDAVTGESDTTNNCSGSVSVVVSESPPQTNPDLAVGSPTVSDSSPTTGATFSLSAAVRNDGDGAAAATTLRYYRSTDATITTADTSVGTDAVGGLAAAATSSESIDLTAPSAPGTFYYGACVDAVTGESDTTNNCSSAVSVTVSAPPPPLPAGPDLTVHGIVTVTSLDGTPPGGSFQLGAAVENQGDEPSAATTLRYYHSTDATITPSDTEVGTDTVGGLSAGATTRIGTDVTAPASAGTYYYGACVDAVTGESDTTNNCSGSVSVVVSESPPQTNPDLAVGSPTVSDSSPTTGATFTLSATLRNDGDGAAAATTLRYYRSTDGTITTSDTSVGTDAVGGLSAGATSPESISLTAPSSAGTYYYGACVDTVTGESDTTNNCSSAVSVTVSAPPPPLPAGPDLTVHGIVTVTSLDGTPPGGSFQLGAAVENQGDEPSAATTLRYYHSTDATITPSDTEVGTDTVGGLSAGATTRIGTDVTAPASAGTYYYGACVDAVTGESDTTNNCSGSVSVVVSESPPQTNPDLAVGSPTVSDSSPTTGATFTLSATLRNDGDGAAATTTLRYYRSTDGTITTSDTSVGTDAVGGLSAGATSPESISLTAPSSAGTSYYGACVDTVTGESDTTNNCSSAVSVTVSAPPPPPPPQTNPDLEVQSPSVNDSSLDTGDSFTLSATVRNDGDGAAAATTLRYYRSTDGTITTSDTSVGTDAVGGFPPGRRAPSRSA